MDALFDAAVAAGASIDAVQQRITADAAYLKSPSEQKAYLCGLHAAFLTLIEPTYVAKPAATPQPQLSAANTVVLVKSPPTPDENVVIVKSPHSATPTLTSLARQQPMMPEATLEPPPAAVISILLKDGAYPLEGGRRFRASRFLLLCCYEATHGPGCPLSEVCKGLIAVATREAKLVELFFRLIGGGSRKQVAACSTALYTEAAVVHRRAGLAATQGGSPAQAVQGAKASQPLRRWLLAEPAAIAPPPPNNSGGGSGGGGGSGRRKPASPVAGQPHSPLGIFNPPVIFTEEQVAAAAVERPGSPSRMLAAHPTLFDNGWGYSVGRHSHERGFNSSSVRKLQPTSGEEASLRETWQSL